MAKFNAKVRLTKTFEATWIEVEADNEDEAWEKADDIPWTEEQFKLEQYRFEVIEVEEEKS